MILFEFLGWLILLLRRLKNKCISLHQMKHIKHGKNCSIRGGTSSFQGDITFGSNVTVGVDSTFMATDARILIGNKVLFGPHVFIITGDHQINQIGKYIIDVHSKTECCDKDVIIEDDVWIGAGSIILKGVTVRKGSVIGAGSVVTKSTRPYSINAGNPCREIRMRFSEFEIAEHEKLLNQNGAE